MKMWPPVQSLGAVMLVSALLCACQSAPVSLERDSANQSEAAVSGERQAPQIEEATIAKIAGEAVPEADELIAAYNSRDFGSPGWRRVSLELVTDGRVTRTFTVMNMWRSEGDGVRTLFLLEEPLGLKGTNYLLLEKRAGAQEMQVHLFLPAGERRVLEVGSDNFDEGLLGSDFAYNDVRMLLPTEGYRYRVAGRTRMGGEPAWVVEAEAVTDPAQRISSWSRARFYLARNFKFLLGADFYGLQEGATEAALLIKQMRVQSFKQERGVWTATSMLMMSGAKKERFSVLTLKDAHFSLQDFEPELFSPAHLPLLADRIQQGWSPREAMTDK